jgi:membrane fusion protein (multidrug efflux system)
MKRRIVVSLVFFLAIALCGGLIGFNFFRDRMIANFFATMQPPPQAVSAADVTTKTWTPGIMAIGTARAENGVELAVQTAGIVKTINIQANRHFAAGDLLVQLDDSVERAELIDAEAAIELQESNFERSTALRSRGFDTQVAYDQAVAQLAAARSKLARLKAVIDQKALKAPFAGVAGIPRINPGQYLQPGTVVATFQNLQSMKVDFTLPEQLAGKVKIGQEASFGLNETELTRSGRVIGIDPRVDPQTRLVSAQALLNDNKDEAIVPGQFLHVRINLPSETNIVTVPQTAVISSLYGDYVYLISDEPKDGQPRSVAKQVFVKVGRREGGVSEILSGIQPGQKVVTSGQNKLQGGSPVKIDNSISVTTLNSNG